MKIRNKNTKKFLVLDKFKVDFADHTSLAFKTKQDAEQYLIDHFERFYRHRNWDDQHYYTRINYIHIISNLELELIEGNKVTPINFDSLKKKGYLKSRCYDDEESTTNFLYIEQILNGTFNINKWFIRIPFGFVESTKTFIQNHIKNETYIGGSSGMSIFIEFDDPEDAMIYLLTNNISRKYEFLTGKELEISTKECIARSGIKV